MRCVLLTISPVLPYGMPTTLTANLLGRLYENTSSNALDGSLKRPVDWPFGAGGNPSCGLRCHVP